MKRKIAYLLQRGDYVVNLGHVSTVNHNKQKELVLCSFITKTRSKLEFHSFDAKEAVIIDPLESKENM